MAVLCAISRRLKRTVSFEPRNFVADAAENSTSRRHAPSWPGPRRAYLIPPSWLGSARRRSDILFVAFSARRWTVAPNTTCCRTKSSVDHLARSTVPMSPSGSRLALALLAADSRHFARSPGRALPRSRRLSPALDRFKRTVSVQLLKPRRIGSLSTVAFNSPSSKTLGAMLQAHRLIRLLCGIMSEANNSPGASYFKPRPAPRCPRHRRLEAAVVK